MIENYGSQDLRKIDLKKINFFKTLNIVTNGDFCKKFEKKNIETNWLQIFSSL